MSGSKMTLSMTTENEIELMCQEILLQKSKSANEDQDDNTHHQHNTLDHVPSNPSNVQSLDVQMTKEILLQKSKSINEDQDGNTHNPSPSPSMNSAKIMQLPQPPPQLNVHKSPKLSASKDSKPHFSPSISTSVVSLDVHMAKEILLQKSKSTNENENENTHYQHKTSDTTIIKSSNPSRFQSLELPTNASHDPLHYKNEPTQSASIIFEDEYKYTVNHVSKMRVHAKHVAVPTMEPDEDEEESLESQPTPSILNNNTGVSVRLNSSSVKDVPRPSSIAANQVTNYMKNKWKSLLTSWILWVRIVILLFSMFIVALAVFYAIAELVTVELDLITECPEPISRDSREETWPISYEINQENDGKSHENAHALQYEYDRECWGTHSVEVNTDRLWYSNYYTAVWNIEINWKCIMFLVVALHCFGIIVYCVYRLLKDIIGIKKENLHENSNTYKGFLKQRNNMMATNGNMA